jgi:hypothetical protein
MPKNLSTLTYFFFGVMILEITKTEVFVDLFNLAVETTKKYIQHSRVSEQDARKQVAALKDAAQTPEQKEQVQTLEQVLTQRQKK